MEIKRNQRLGSGHILKIVAVGYEGEGAGKEDCKLFARAARMLNF